MIDESKINASIDLILKEMGDPQKDFRLENRQSVRLFLKRIKLEDLVDYSALSNSKLYNKSIYSKFKYFCGICHNVIKENNEAFNGKN